MSKSNKVLLLLGTNMGNRKDNLGNAIKFIEKKVGEVLELSMVEETEPVGFTADMDFYNQLVRVETILSPITLLRTIKKIEKDMGRIYSQPKEGEQYVSRIIDIDILFYNDIKYESKMLKLPHHQVFSRDFVRQMLGRRVKSD